MGIPGWGALVHFPDETKVVTVWETPERGQPLIGNLPWGWLAEDVTLREGEFEGQSYQYEVRAKRSE
jgi:hypothetical protein